MKIISKRGPKVDPCGTTALTGNHLDVGPCKTIIWNLFLRKLVINLRGIYPLYQYNQHVDKLSFARIRRPEIQILN